MPEISQIVTVKGVPVLQVTRTQEFKETYTLGQLEETIAILKNEIANIQARLAYQEQLKTKLTAAK